MSLDNKDIERIAHLARLEVAEEDIPIYRRNLSDILAFVDQMGQTSTENVIPMAHPMDAVQRQRPDEVTEHVDRDRFQKIAPQIESGLYLVPKVIE